MAVTNKKSMVATQNSIITANPLRTFQDVPKANHDKVEILSLVDIYTEVQRLSTKSY